MFVCEYVFITSAKEVMFLLTLVSLFVRWLVGDPDPGIFVWLFDG